uniref:(northern house mosquito) hypothetical protein n=1 Tax=Culex pipiens TaxID=7175 RepID=A0A8D8EUI8_CULPI
MVETSVALSLQCLCSRVRLHAHKQIEHLLFTPLHHCHPRACACVLAVTTSFDVSAKRFASFRRHVQFSITPIHRRLRPPFIVNRTLIAHSRFLCLSFFLFLPFWRGHFANHLQIIKIKKRFFSSNRPLHCANILDFVLTQGSRALLLVFV